MNGPLPIGCAPKPSGSSSTTLSGTTQKLAMHSTWMNGA